MDSKYVKAYESMLNQLSEAKLRVDPNKVNSFVNQQIHTVSDQPQTMEEDGDTTEPSGEVNQATLNVPNGNFTIDKNANTISGTTNVHGVDINATRDMTPGGAKTFSASTNVVPNLNMTATQKSADYNKGQLAGTKSVSAKYTDTAGALGKPDQQHTATRTAGIGFGGASGANVGKNYVDQYTVNEDELDAMRRIINHRR
jgi:hypothetical protein